ncbi:DUF4157 domain-containing protein [Cuspidothrix issatschenkoi LEGE 03284]|uniref:eCIS core domain-containing protein n=1 Tax=Cuspidothrix issatschenkoi TaxID=230752 RepID=UPI001882BABB|nr:DUF4157 domain-containing protein [Cuspidothrix issatschenkoi]MBE9232466.1 DUF4157 domain-containing protein [Cuspidothrix issatschenkoi LEGE 03284]
MREQVGQSKKATTSFSIPTLKQPTRGFGLESLDTAPQATTEVESVNPLLTHDISRISMRPQAKLSISQPGDFHEQQADSVAQQVMRRMAQPVHRQSIQRQQAPDPEDLQMKSVDNFHTSWLQRQQVPEEEEIPEEDTEVQRSSMVQRRPSTGGIAATDDLETSIQQSRGGGQPLADDIKRPMEQAFGADFTNVNIHTDDNSDKLNKSIQARAFTTGQDIFFRQGEYSPGSNTGKELLAHELTHVVQQNGSAVQRKSLHLAPKENKLQTKYARDGQTIQLRENPQKTTEVNDQNQTDVVEVKTDTENSEQQNQVTTEKHQAASTLPAGAGNGVAEPGNQQKQPESKDSDSNSQKISSQQQGEGKLPGVATELPAANVNNTTAVQVGAETSNGEKAPTSPEDDPAFQAVVNSTKQVAIGQKEHPPANAEAQEAQNAAEPPGNEVESKAQANQVGEMGQAQTPGFDTASLKAKLMERIADMAPKNLKEADEFKNNNKLDAVKGDLSGKVKEQKQDSQSDLEEKTKAKPDTSGIETKQVTPLTANNPGAAPANIGADKATPKSKGQGEVEAPLKKDSQNLDQKMAEANVTEEQLAKSNEPDFQAALSSKKEAQTDAVQAPAKYRQQEEGIIANAKATAEATAQQHLEGMHGIRSQHLGQVADQQVGTKGKDEQARAKVAGDINKIYEGTKTKVEKTLGDLDGKVQQEFDAGAAEAKKAFEDYVGKRMDDYKSDRYGGTWGWTKWIKDQFVGLPNEVNVFYTEGRQFYIKQMDGVINKVVAIISQGLTQAKAEIANGKREIQNYINQLPQDLKGVGQEAAATIESKFEELEQSVENKQNELIDTLAQKYQENLQAVDARIDEMKAANKGLIEKALDFVVGVVKTIIELTKMLIEVLARAASVVGQIIKDPIGFFSNLVSAVKQGFLNFMKNIGTHLQNGLIGWLTGTMAQAGIQMPENFDLKGIFSLAMQLLGFTYEAIRAQAVKRLGEDGEEKVSRMEQTVEVFQILATQGVAGIWQFVQEKMGDLNALIIDPIKNFIIEKVITAGIEWVLSLLTPASAFIKACQGIYNIVKFFIERAQQIADLINAILDSIVAIASGSLDQAIKGVENALAKSLPVVISFLASLLGLDGIAGKIQAIFQKLRKPMETAVNWVIDKGTKAFKAVGNKFNKSKFGKKFNAVKDSAKEKYKAGKQWVEDKKEAAHNWVEGKKEAMKDKYTKTVNKGKEKVAAIVEWWKAKQKFTAKDGEAHTLFFEGTDENANLMIASKKRSYEEFIDDIDVNNQPDSIKKVKTEAKTIAGRIEKIGKNRKGKGKGVQTAEGQEIKQEIVHELNNLAVPTSILAAASTSQPPSVVEYGSLTSEGGATFMNAKILSQKNVKGSSPQDKPAIWEKANRRKGVYLQGHLLTAHLGGPGRAFNLAPITDYTNKQHLKFVEKDVKKAVLDHNQVVRFKVDVVYSKHPERSSQKAIEDRLNNGTSTDKNKDQHKLEIMKYEQENLPRAFANEWAILKHDGTKWVDDNVKDTLYILNTLPDSEPN